MLSIGLLSWRAHKTLRKTLDSYRAADLMGCADEFKVFFNEISEEDRALAAEYGVEADGSPENLGIWGGMDGAAAALKGEWILLLQNDCPVVSSPEETRRWLRDGVRLLESGKADMIRMRHRFNQGEGISFERFFGFSYVHEPDERHVRYNGPLPESALRDSWKKRLRRWCRPFAFLRRVIAVIHLEKHPDRVLPKYIRKEGRFYVIDSRIINFSEQPMLISKRLYQELSAFGRRRPCKAKVNGRPLLEITLNSRWWRRHHFKVAVCDEGVFTHNRYDDSFRRENAAFNAAAVAGETA